jgi:predicted  nucleic acid-binding Zn-ribbon protein
LRSAEDTNPTLERLEAQERAISARRARLHDRIDFLRANGNADGTTATPEQLEALDEQERELSQERKKLHARIRELRQDQHPRGEAG